MSMADHCHFVVAVDFGTTYSSVTFHRRAFGEDLRNATDSNPRLFPVGNYPGATANKKEEIFEVPTELLYCDGQTFWGHDACNKWVDRLGENRYRNGIRVQWFKLLLDENESRQREASSAAIQLESLGLTVNDAILEYLTLLLAHTKSQLRIYHRYCESCTVQLVLTVPNVWNARACSIMAYAMESASREILFGHQSEVFLVSEADAAATYFCEKASDLFLNLGDVFMIADAGGGTSDLMIYKVLHMYPFRFDAVVPGKGIVCGSSHLNQSFARDLKAAIQSDSRYGDSKDYLPEGWTIDDILRSASQDFELTKRSITNEQTGEYIPVPFLPKLQDDPHSAPFSFYADRDFIADIFHPHLQKIFELIRSLMEDVESTGESCGHVILIGGFSLSDYLVDFLRKNISSCLILREHTSQDAISRGGCLRYLNQFSGPDEIMQASYGFLRQELLQPEEFEGHEPGSAVEERDTDDGELYARDCVSYVVHRGQRVPAQGQTFPQQSFTLTRTFRSVKADLKIGLELFENRSVRVPDDHFHFKHDRNNECVSQGEIEFIIPARDLRRLAGPRRWSRHNRSYYYTLGYEARIRILGKNIRYELWLEGRCGTYGVLTGFSTAAPVTGVEEQFRSLAL